MSERVIGFLLFSGVAIFGAICGGALYRGYNTSAKCLALGYPDSSFTLSKNYCIKRVNQTDVVVELPKDAK